MYSFIFESHSVGLNSFRIMEKKLNEMVSRAQNYYNQLI